jgi:hypothetical protein
MDGGMDGGIHELKYPHSPRVPVPHDPRMQALTWLDGQERVVSKTLKTARCCPFVLPRLLDGQ